MTPALAVYALLTGSLVAVTAAGVEGICRLLGRPTRWVWVGALALTVGLVALAPLRVTEPARAPYLSSEVRVRTAAPDAEAGVSLLHALRERVTSRVQGAVVAAVRRVPLAVEGGLVWAWPAASALLLLLLARTHLRYGRARRAWPTAELHGLSIRVSPAAGPAVIGWVRPAIVVPRWLLALGEEEQRLVLAHEREHLRARDPLLLAIGCAAAALLPWHPASWWMLARLRLAVELDCDTRVLRQGATPGSYGALLIDLAGRCSGFPIGAPALAGLPSHLHRRLLAMTAQPRRFPIPRAAALGALALLALAVACEARLPTAAEIEQMDVASAEAGTGKAVALLTTGDRTIYTVDGAEVSAEEARALSAGRIGQIEISRAAAEGEISIIRIRTREASTSLEPVDAPASRERMRFVRPGEVPDFAGIILIDGLRAEPLALRELKPDQIQSVEVLKGDAATRISSDPAAANGIIRVTTRAAAKRP